MNALQQMVELERTRTVLENISDMERRNETESFNYKVMKIWMKEQLSKINN